MSNVQIVSTSWKVFKTFMNTYSDFNRHCTKANIFIPEHLKCSHGPDTWKQSSFTVNKKMYIRNHVRLHESWWKHGNKRWWQYGLLVKTHRNWGTAGATVRWQKPCQNSLIISCKIKPHDIFCRILKCFWKNKILKWKYYWASLYVSFNYLHFLL